MTLSVSVTDFLHNVSGFRPDAEWVNVIFGGIVVWYLTVREQTKQILQSTQIELCQETRDKIGEVALILAEYYIQSDGTTRLIMESKIRAYQLDIVAATESIVRLSRHHNLGMSSKIRADLLNFIDGATGHPFESRNFTPTSNRNWQNTLILLMRRRHRKFFLPLGCTINVLSPLLKASTFPRELTRNQLLRLRQLNFCQNSLMVTIS